ncbi:MAG TPA: LodA/GoxA family CTQ-dependent oxidase [Blastocatellia bacterium]|nr:LodA/GoxA family CTQ-dependent oxidase [Blastocatellia bacterium]
MAPIYKIHPAIGIARVGNSPDYYIAPETPGGLPILPDGKPFTPADFRDDQRQLRRQGARFRVFKYDAAEASGASGIEILPGAGGVKRIEWRVHLANKKSIWYQFVVLSGEYGYSPDHALRNSGVTDSNDRVKLVTDPGWRELKEPNSSVEFSRTDNPDNYPMTFPPADLKPFGIDSLGGLRTDSEGRLIVLGGFGSSGSSQEPVEITDYANNDGWYDDVSDGPVTARVVMDDDSVTEVQVPSWVIVAPPRYAPQLLNLVTLYDSVFDTSVRNMGLRPDIFANDLWNTNYVPSFEQDIEPILKRAESYPWVVAIPPHPHAFAIEKLGDPAPRYNELRQYYLQIVRPPSTPNSYASPVTGFPMMPFLAGDNAFVPGPYSSSYLTVTDTQYFFLQQWAAGKFTVGEAPVLGPGEALDRAALENCVGGAFSPGIEMTWLCRNPLIYSEPFRIKHKKDVTPPLSLGQDFAAGLEPGDVGKYMALPWQADFNECSSQPVGDKFLWWWPVQRPLFVHVEVPRDEQHFAKYSPVAAVFEGGHPARLLKQVPWVGSDKDQNASDYLQFGQDIEMVTNWKYLGFIYNAGTGEKPEYIEVERTLPRGTNASAAGGD